MKVVLLAGGAGIRISGEIVYRPKPMVEDDGDFDAIIPFWKMLGM